MEKTTKATAKKAKALATEVTETAATATEQTGNVLAELVEDIKEAGQELKAVATKNMDKIAEKVGLADNFEKVKKVATQANEQFMDMAEDFTEEVKEKSKELRAATSKLAKEALENIKLTDRLNAVKKAAKNANQYALETSEELIETLAENGEKWQNVGEKALNTSLKLAEKQQTILFNTLETVKTQVGSSAIRFRKLFKNN